MTQGKFLAKAAMGMILVTMLSKLLGFGRELVIAGKLGVTPAADAFKTASFIPMILFSVIAAALTNTFIPLLTELEAKKGEQEVNRFVANLSNTITILLTIIGVIGLLLNPYIIKLIAPGFTQQTFQLTVKMAYWLMPVIIFLGLIGLTSGYLNFRGIFTLPKLSGVVFNLIIISALIFMVPKIGVYGVVFGLIAAYLGQVGFLMILAWRNGYRMRLFLDWRDPYLMRMLKLALPMIIGTAVGVLANFVDRIFASSLVSGSVSALDYASRLNDFALGIFVSTISGVYFPTLSRTGASQDWESFKKHLLKAINFVVYLLLPVAVGLMILSEPIVHLLFERGTFDNQATSMTAVALFYSNIGLIGFGIQDIFSQGFYAVQDTVTPLISGILMNVINITLNYFLVKEMGLGGIALSTSIAATLMLFFMPWRLKKKIPEFNYQTLWVSAGKSISAVLFMAFGLKGFDYLMTAYLIGTSQILLKVALEVLVAMSLYLIALRSLKVSELDDLIKFFGRSGKKVKNNESM